MLLTGYNLSVSYPTGIRSAICKSSAELHRPGGDGVMWMLSLPARETGDNPVLTVFIGI
jgi:hypothetical protein